MSTEVTPELLRTVLAAWEGGSASDAYARNELHQWAKNMEREQRPLPTVPANLILTPVGEHPEPGTRGLLPVEVGIGGEGWVYNLGENFLCKLGGRLSGAVLADPRPDGAHE